MENVSKALIMAGGVLVGIIILSLLVTFYSNVRNLQKTQQDVEINEQAIEFNKKFDEYDKETLYGSEFLSLINKVCDYNTRYVKDVDSEFYEGYDQIELVIKFKKDYIIEERKGDDDHPQLNYDAVTIAEENKQKVINATHTELKDAIDTIEDILENFRNPKYSVYKNNDNNNVYIDLNETVGLATKPEKNYGTNPATSAYHSELSLYLQNNKNITNPDIVNHIQQDTAAYRNIKSKFTQFKNRKFKSVKFTYDDYTGKISQMEFEEIEETT